MDEVIKLNVGGQIYLTTRGTLCAEPGSMLATKFGQESNFAPPTMFEDAVFIDRNPKTFEYILDYLRHGCQIKSCDKVPPTLVKSLQADADYFGLVNLQNHCNKLINSSGGKLYHVVDLHTFQSYPQNYRAYNVEKVIPEFQSSAEEAMVILSKPSL